MQMKCLGCGGQLGVYACRGSRVIDDTGVCQSGCDRGVSLQTRQHGWEALGGEYAAKKGDRGSIDQGQAFVNVDRCVCFNLQRLSLGYARRAGFQKQNFLCGCSAGGNKILVKPYAAADRVVGWGHRNKDARAAPRMYKTFLGQRSQGLAYRMAVYAKACGKSGLCRQFVALLVEPFCICSSRVRCNGFPERRSVGHVTKSSHFGGLAGAELFCRICIVV